MLRPLQIAAVLLAPLPFLLVPLKAQEKPAAPAPAAPAPAGPDRVPPAEVHRPLGVPDRVILTWQGDPARSQAVTWRTDSRVALPVAEIARADAGPAFTRAAKMRVGSSTRLDSDLGTAYYHSVSFEGLSPATTYAYRVGDGANWSEWFHFRTASDNPEPFSFIYFGDAQNDLKSLWSRVVRQAYSDASRARFIVHAGDLVNNATRDAEWGEWFSAGGWVNGMVPSLPTPGNHEYVRYGEPGTPRILAKHWRPLFALPENGPEGLEETAYYVDYQGVRLISLNSNERREEQAEWLEGVLRDNPNRWTILAFHHPVYSAAPNRDNKALRQLWEPIFRKYRVDLVLTGHDHTYARSGLDTPRNESTGMSTQDAENGTVYVVSVSGPKMYNLKREPWMERAAEDTQLYQIISVDEGTLKYEARTAVGELYDAFELRKRRGAINRLIDRAPKDLPERLRPPAVSRPAATTRS